MKRLIAVLLTVAMLLSLCACAKPTPQPEPEDNPKEDPKDEPVEEEPTSYTLDNTKDLRSLGRTYYSGNDLHFDFAGSGFEFSFTGTSVVAKLCASGGGAEITVFVDGERANKLYLNTSLTEYKLAENLKNEKHTVKVVKSAMLCTVGTYVTGITVEGKLAAVPEKKERQILALGDSLSVGRAVLGDSSTVGSTPKVNDCTYATPWLIAEHFNADLELVADTGYGIWQSSGSDREKVIPKVWKTVSYVTNYPYDFTKSDPDLILINLGTNDVQAKPNTTIKDFMDAWNAFIDDIRAQYPTTPILYYYGMMNVCSGNASIIKKLVSLRNTAGDSNIYYLGLDSISNHTDLGVISYGHPTVNHYEYYAPIVEQKISEILGW